MAEKNNDARSDEELMRQYQEGNSAAFESLYSRYSSRVYGFIFSQVKNRAQTDDIFQATFLKLHQARHHYDPSFPFLPWMFTVTKSVLLDAIRKRALLREVTDEQALENAIVQDQKQEPVDLGRLEGAQKEAVQLRYVDDLSFEDIAKKLNTSPANVRQLISRGIKRLRSVKSGGLK